MISTRWHGGEGHANVGMKPVARQLAFVRVKVNMDTKIILRPVAGRSAMHCISPVNVHTGKGVSSSGREMV